MSIWVMMTLLLTLLPVGVYAYTYMAPGMRANARKNNIDKRISYAMSFIAAMASADVNVDIIFKELSRQPIYGEIQKEAQWINRDIDLMGVDTLTALSDAAARTPSDKFQDFLQGVVTTARSGGKMKPFFIMKADQYMKERRIEEKKLIIRLLKPTEDRLRIEVIDNGVGIALENLEKIFQHGFTTKEKGHGFGLHSSALAAKDMGGSLAAHSNGVGQGATFTLELPLKPVEVMK